MLTKASHHPHSELMAQYTRDAMTIQNPWEIWEFRVKGSKEWLTLSRAPRWEVNCEYRRVEEKL